MKKYFSFFFFALLTMFLVACDSNTPTNSSDNDSDEPSVAKGIGAFSVSDTTQVTFSPGNLQYTQSTDTWSFASAQYEIIGVDNVIGGTVSSDPEGGDYKHGTALADKIDLFGWGTGDCPTKSSESENDYLTFVDWGTNKIDNDAPNIWRTLSMNEWMYIFYNRPNAQSLFALGSVNGVNGTIILPDNCTTPADVSFVASTTKGLSWQENCYMNNNGTNYGDNTYTSEQWSKLEKGGAVFLPASGFRLGTYMGNAFLSSSYWSNTKWKSDNYNAHILHFRAFCLLPQFFNWNFYGYSVRLVQDL